MSFLQFKFDKLRKAANRVRELHSIDTYNNRCRLCQNHGDFGNPCQTIKALND